MENTIFHIDMDCYFASVEIKENKEYENKPIAVGGRFYSGVVSSANYIARKQGVRSAMALFEAKKICPELVIVDCNMDKYIEISYQIDAFLSSIVKKIEKGSIDEWYIDVSGSKFENWNEFEFGSYIKHEIYKKFQLKCSIGNSFTTFLAKMATDLCKPDGFLTLNKNNFKKYIYDLDIDNVVGIGINLSKILKNEFNIYKIKDIVNVKNEFFIKKRIGVNWSKLKFNVMGINVDKINPHYLRKNLGRSYSIKNYTDYQEFYCLIANICKDINLNLTKNNFMFKNLNMKLKLKDNKHLSKTTFYQNYIEQFNFVDAIDMFEKMTDKSFYSEILNIAITANDLIKKQDFKKQLSFFDKKENINQIDFIKNKINNHFNKEVVVLLSQKNNKKF